jgi:hypothetical protein
VCVVTEIHTLQSAGLCGSTNEIKQGKSRKERNIRKLQSTLTLPTLLYGSENWVLRNRNKSRIDDVKITANVQIMYSVRQDKELR